MFDQAVRQPMIMEDSARESTLVRQRDEGEASVSLIPHSSQNSMGSEEEEEWITSELDDLGKLIEGCWWLGGVGACSVLGL